MPVLMVVLWWCFWRPAVVDQRAGFFLDGSSGPTGTSPGGRPARDGSLLRRTWRGISVMRKVHGGWKGKDKERKGRVVELKATSNHLLLKHTLSRSLSTPVSQQWHIVRLALPLFGSHKTVQYFLNCTTCQLRHGKL